MATNPDQVQVVHHVTGVTEVIPAVPPESQHIQTTFQEVHLPVSQSETVQVIQMDSGDASQGKIYQVITVEQPEGTQNDTQVSQQVSDITPTSTDQMQDVTNTSVAALLESASGVVVHQVQESTPHKELPPGCPAWAARLKECESIGDSYRGYVESEVELDLLLTYHKQQTGTFWGTRQSPSQNKPSKRLMWKSQYVPYDGVPFLNAGSRAIVMECQYGPRRKGGQTKKTTDPSGFKTTCPARIYIKKVRKFPELKVDTGPGVDRKTLRLQQDRAFAILREKPDDIQGVERFYVQLPTTKAHEYHDDPPTHIYGVNINIGGPVAETPLSQRMHPRVADKLRQIVCEGNRNVYHVRKLLRAFVERELFHGETIPEKHNLAYFPTIHDIQNHVHKAVKEINTGVLQVVNTGVPVTRHGAVPLQGPGENTVVNTGVPVTITDGLPASDEQATADAASQLQQQLWQATNEDPQPQTVTVTLTQNPGEENGAVISLVETTLSDGTTQVSNTLSPKTAQLLSQLNPRMFENSQIARIKNDGSDTVTIEMQHIQPAATAEGETLDATAVTSEQQDVPIVTVALPTQSGLSTVEQLLQPQEEDKMQDEPETAVGSIEGTTEQEVTMSVQ
ncbi:calcium-responsive transcription factor-like [Glandiceps talaboti]